MRRRTIYTSRRAFAGIVIFSGIVVFLFTNVGNWVYEFNKTSASSEESSASSSLESASDSSGSSPNSLGSSDSSSSSGSSSFSDSSDSYSDSTSGANSILSRELLEKLEIKGRAPKTNYSRKEFYDTWPVINGCNLRQRILSRDLTDIKTDKNCNVISGKFYDFYTGQISEFTDRSEISKNVQIDHIVALSDAWQKGAQNLSRDERFRLATDALNLIAVGSTINQKKSDGDAATWLPPNKSFRCEYISRQISVKYKYRLWLTQAEHDAMSRVLDTCPKQTSIL